MTDSVDSCEELGNISDIPNIAAKSMTEKDQKLTRFNTYTNKSKSS